MILVSCFVLSLKKKLQQASNFSYLYFLFPKCRKKYNLYYKPLSNAINLWNGELNLQGLTWNFFVILKTRIKLKKHDYWLWCFFCHEWIDRNWIDNKLITVTFRGKKAGFNLVTYRSWYKLENAPLRLKQAVSNMQILQCWMKCSNRLRAPLSSNIS